MLTLLTLKTLLRVNVNILYQMLHALLMHLLSALHAKTRVSNACNGPKRGISCIFAQNGAFEPFVTHMTELLTQRAGHERLIPFRRSKRGPAHVARVSCIPQPDGYFSTLHRSSRGFTPASHRLHASFTPASRRLHRTWWYLSLRLHGDWHEG